ncbi:MAG: hypothetical protein R6W70_02815 [bacterium]
MKIFYYLLIFSTLFLFFSCTEKKEIISENARVFFSEGEAVVTNMRCSSAHFSPDGKSIAYSGEKFRGIYVKDLEKGELTVISEDEGTGWGFAWSPDSGGIAFRKKKDEKNGVSYAIYKRSLDSEKNELVGVFEETVQPPLWRDTIYSVKLESFSNITLAVKPPTLLRNPPPSLRVNAFVSDNRISLIDIKTGKVKNLEKGTHAPAISKDGKKLIYVHYDTIKILDLETREKKIIGKGTSPSWRYDGKEIIYNHSVDNGKNVIFSEIRIYSTITGKTEAIRPSSSEIPIYPSLSPDGKKIVFTDALTGHLFIMERE